MTAAYTIVGGTPPLLVEPTLVVMLSGWIDASGAAASAMLVICSWCKKSIVKLQTES